MISDTREFAQNHAIILATLGDGDPQKLFAGQRVAHVVQHRRHVVAAIHVREHLSPRAALAHFLESAMQVTDLNITAEDGLARQLNDNPYRPMCGRMRGPHVEQHWFVTELELCTVEISFDGLHAGSQSLSSSVTRAWWWVCLPKLIPSSGPKGGSLPVLSTSRYAISGWVLSAG